MGSCELTVGCKDYILVFDVLPPVWSINPGPVLGYAGSAVDKEKNIREPLQKHKQREPKCLWLCKQKFNMYYRDIMWLVVLNNVCILPLLPLADRRPLYKLLSFDNWFTKWHLSSPGLDSSAKPKGKINHQQSLNRVCCKALRHFKS